MAAGLAALRLELSLIGAGIDDAPLQGGAFARPFRAAFPMPVKWAPTPFRPRNLRRCGAPAQSARDKALRLDVTQVTAQEPIELARLAACETSDARDRRYRR
jgi:hypothetical protein